MKILLAFIVTILSLFAAGPVSGSNAVYVHGEGRATYLTSYPDFSKEIAFINAKVHVARKIETKLSSLFQNIYRKSAKKLSRSVTDGLIDTILKECKTKKVHTDNQKIYTFINCKISKKDIKSMITEVFESSKHIKRPPTSIIDRLTNALYGQIR